MISIMSELGSGGLVSTGRQSLLSEADSRSIECRLSLLAAGLQDAVGRSHIGSGMAWILTLM
jgi:hypothetical protein